MPRTLRSWSDALATLDMEQVELVTALTADDKRDIAAIVRPTGRQTHDGERILGEALLHLGKRFLDQARAATDGRRQ